MPYVFLSPQTPIRLEAENALLNGPQIAHERKGYSGTGYVTDITKDGATITWHFNAKAGIYRLGIAYASQGQKGFELKVDGYGSSGMMPNTHDSWAIKDAGKVVLKNGPNELEFDRGWGYFDLDYVRLTPAIQETLLKPIPPRLVDPRATPEAKALFAKLLKTYGQSTYTGQYQPDECAYIQRQTGRTPAILGGDLIDYSPSRAERRAPEDDIPGWIKAARRGRLLTLSWHWNAPSGLIDEKVHKMPDGHIEDASWEKGFYTYATTFDLQEALADPNGQDYKLLLRDIDAIAVQLKRLQVAHVPVLWRPLHEADGGWFWWGAKGPGPCRQLWRLLFDRLTKFHGLHNLIWVWSSPDPDWSPGDEYFDIMSIDAYPSERRDGLSDQWEEQFGRYNGRKPLALAEFPGAPDVDHMRRLGVRWLYFVSWLGDVGPRSTDPKVLKETYRSRFVINGR